jgi:mannose-6-phosphate isomerase-like protein (cupin superfamily)
MLEVRKLYDIETNELIPDTQILVRKAEIVEKGWGHEKIIYNGNTYCGKILVINEAKKFSLHYHVEKHETWYVLKGKVSFTWIEPQGGKWNGIDLNVGDCVTIPQGVAHQLFAYEDSEIMEASTPHKDSDSYRIQKGD